MSWNDYHVGDILVTNSQPPCEAVSWNINWRYIMSINLGSASLWGCELKYNIQICSCNIRYSQPPCEAVSWNTNYECTEKEAYVSLLVRLWVEMSWGYRLWGVHLSASLWGCELKSQCLLRIIRRLTSASLWGCELKYNCGNLITDCFRSASLWGCELKWTAQRFYSESYFVSLLVRLWVEMFPNTA